ncbi:MAG: IS1595 family transposase [Desulfomonilaceae bacterium]
MEAKNLNLATLSPLFADEEAARKFIESQRWPNGPVCPRCGCTDHYTLTPRPTSRRPVRAGVYTCKGCKKQYTVRIGMVFEDSHIPLNKWLIAMHLMMSSKKGISSLQLSREVGVTVKSAWFMSHRIREALVDDPQGSLLGGTVEVDETYVGGKPRKGSGPVKRGRGTKKTPVMVLVERDGKARTQRVDRVNAKELKGAIKTHVKRDSKIVTDEFLSYRGIGEEFDGGHSVVHHSSEQFVNEEGEHTNTAESFFALLKRGHYGIFHSLSKQHLFRYCNEFVFRWNNRKVTDGERMVEVIKGAEGKRLMYRESQGGILRG